MLPRAHDFTCGPARVAPMSLVPAMAIPGAALTPETIRYGTERMRQKLLVSVLIALVKIRKPLVSVEFVAYGIQVGVNLFL